MTEQQAFEEAREDARAARYGQPATTATTPAHITEALEKGISAALYGRVGDIRKLAEHLARDVVQPLLASAWDAGREAQRGYAEAMWEHSREAEPGMGADPPDEPDNPYEGEAP